MIHPRLLLRGAVVTFLLAACAGGLSAAEPPVVSFEHRPGKVDVLIAGQPLATYVYADHQILRPYLAHVRAPGGIQVTRNHPPVPGQDPDDHRTMHPGIWMAFGDISGSDFWRNKAKVVHQGFVELRAGAPGKGSFAVRNRYLAALTETEGDSPIFAARKSGQSPTTDPTADAKPVCEQRCRLTFLVRPAGYLILWDSTFSPVDEAFYFGDQEEMGLGVRVASPLRVEAGGVILDAEGRKNEEEVWGNAAHWCDYSGTINGRRVGVTLMCDPSNFRPSWFHARDYGLLVANPFGRDAFDKGPPSRVVVQPGETLRLRFGILLYSTPHEQPIDLEAAYGDFLSQLQEQ